MVPTVVKLVTDSLLMFPPDNARARRRCRRRSRRSFRARSSSSDRVVDLVRSEFSLTFEAPPVVLGGIDKDLRGLGALLPSLVLFGFTSFACCSESLDIAFFGEPNMELDFREISFPFLEFSFTASSSFFVDLA